LTPKKIKLIKTLKNNKLPYSAKNNKAKENLLYSVLNPETNSLSPSAKSNGARFSSTKTIIKNKKRKLD